MGKRCGVGIGEGELIAAATIIYSVEFVGLFLIAFGLGHVLDQVDQLETLSNREFFVREREESMHGEWEIQSLQGFQQSGQ